MYPYIKNSLTDAVRPNQKVMNKNMLSTAGVEAL